MSGTLIDTPVAVPTVAALLNRRSTYLERPPAVECIETHISWVFLAGRFAYKLKKPVQFEFLDFSTPELRRNACLDELHLNRRMAPGIYLKVLPITEDRGRLTLDGHGTPIDWVVKMQRLPRRSALDRRLRDGAANTHETIRLAETLANFYAQALPLTIRPDDYRAGIAHHIRANQSTLCRLDHGIPQRCVRRTCAAQLRFLITARDLLDARVCDGRIIEGHGDLRPEHIYLTPRPVVIDCIEFNKDLRTLDVADELAFLQMECERLGAPDPGDLIWQHYRQISGDDPPEPLLNFYKCYRACVRAKVHALRGSQIVCDDALTEVQQQRSYLALADRYSAQLGRPHVIIVRGLMGTGKSTLATSLADQLGCELLQTDAVRQEMSPTAQRKELAYGEGAYQLPQRREIYRRLLQSGDELLRDRLSVILDGAFLTQELREQAHALAQRWRATILDVRCECPAEIAKARIDRRIALGSHLSDGRSDLFDSQRADETASVSARDTIAVDTTVSLTAQTEKVLQHLSRRLRG